MCFAELRWRYLGTVTLAQPDMTVPRPAPDLPMPVKWTLFQGLEGGSAFVDS